MEWVDTSTCKQVVLKIRSNYAPDTSTRALSEALKNITQRSTYGMHLVLAVGDEIRLILFDYPCGRAGDGGHSCPSNPA